MVRVYTAQTLANVANVRNILEANGIGCVLRNEFVGPGFGELPAIEWPEVWVDDTDAERAQQLIAEANDASTPTTEAWRCKRCGEDIDAVFGECWNCGAERPV